MKNLLFFLSLIVFAGCGGDDCAVVDLLVETGDCTCENSFELTIDFEYIDAPTEFYSLYIRSDTLVGYYKLEDLPLTIDKFEVSGRADEYIKICLDDTEDCCKEYEFQRPNCEISDSCTIYDLVVETGNCLNEESYNLFLDFEYEAPGNQYFDLFVRQNQLYGSYLLSDLPLNLDGFPISGNDYDFIKVCINDNLDCCKEIEYMSPNCSEECEILEVLIEQGACTSDSTYNLYLDFAVTNPSHSNFELFVRNNQRIGNYPLSDLPLTLDFEMSGADYDFLKICMSDDIECCKELEFMSPICNEEEECTISIVEVEVLECTSDSTYNLLLDFDYANAGNSFFDVFVRNQQFVDFYRLEDLPITIKDFELSGSDYDFIKVCINDNPDCCYEIEFMAPEC